MPSLQKLCIPTIVSITVYILVNKFFPEDKDKDKIIEKDPVESLRGGDRTKLVGEILKKILEERAVKIALVSLFATAGFQHFQQEIEALLCQKVFEQLCVENTDGKLKIVCDIVKDLELHSQADSVKELLISNKLTNEQKISLLKIKLDFIINGECMGMRRFLIVTIIGGLLCFTISGVRCWWACINIRSLLSSVSRRKDFKSFI